MNMNYLSKVVVLLFSLIFANLSQAVVGTYMTVTADVSTIKESVNFQGCSKIISTAPGFATYTFLQDGTFEENIDGNIRDGYWSEIDGTEKKFRLTYDGNASQGTGSWDAYVDNLDTVADTACDGAYVLRPTLLIKKFELTIGSGCTGKAKMTFDAAGSGYNPNYDQYGKGAHKWSGSGVFSIPL